MGWAYGVPGLWAYIRPFDPSITSKLTFYCEGFPGFVFSKAKARDMRIVFIFMNGGTISVYEDFSKGERTSAFSLQSARVEH